MITVDVSDACAELDAIAEFVMKVITSPAEGYVVEYVRDRIHEEMMNVMRAEGKDESGTSDWFPEPDEDYQDIKEHVYGHRIKMKKSGKLWDAIDHASVDMIGNPEAGYFRIFFRWEAWGPSDSFSWPDAAEVTPPKLFVASRRLDGKIRKIGIEGRGRKGKKPRFVPPEKGADWDYAEFYQNQSDSRKIILSDPFLDSIEDDIVRSVEDIVESQK